MFETVYKDMFIKALEEKLARTKQYLERRWHLCEWDLQKELDKTSQLLVKKETVIVRQWESMCRHMKKRLIFKMADELRKEKILELKQAWMTQRMNYWEAKEETDFQRELNVHWKSECQKRTNEVVNLVELMLVTGNT
jgi:hypothetical protein